MIGFLESKFKADTILCQVLIPGYQPKDYKVLEERAVCGNTFFFKHYLSGNLSNILKFE